LLCSSLLQPHNKRLTSRPLSMSLVSGRSIRQCGPKNRTETKLVEIKQEGNKLSGHFKGPYQSGFIEGTIEGHHIVFHTKTRQVLNFRGHVEGDTIKGTWGTRGIPGEWEARRQ
jgi:hypothetical protein